MKKTEYSDNQEIWKAVKGFKGYYEVSDMGRVRSLDRVVKSKGKGKREVKGQEIKPRDNGRGYKFVELFKHGKSQRVYVHRLVALNFLDNPLEKPCVNHKNFKRDDNRLENLEFVTYEENNLHASSRRSLLLGRMIQAIRLKVNAS